MTKFVQPFADINCAILKLGQLVLIFCIVEELADFFRQIKLIEDIIRQRLLGINWFKQLASYILLGGLLELTKHLALLVLTPLTVRCKIVVHDDCFLRVSKDFVGRLGFSIERSAFT